MLKPVYKSYQTQSTACNGGLMEDPMCVRCKDKPATLQHILSACPVTLEDERYIWQHNRELKTIAAKLDNQKEKREAEEHLICKFHEVGEKRRAVRQQ